MALVVRMSEEGLNQLEQDLAQSPLDWQRRLDLVQAYVGLGRLQDAKTLLRDSPDAAGPPPPPIQQHLHRLMTQGGVAVEAMAETGEGVEPLRRPAESPPPQERQELPKDLPAQVAKPLQIVPAKQLSGERENNGVVMELLEGFVLQSRAANAGQKVSALTVALLVHLLLIFLLTAIAMKVPVQQPPQIVVVSMREDKVQGLAAKRIEKKSRSKAAAVMARTTLTISSSALSPVTMPEFEFPGADRFPGASLALGTDLGVGDGIGGGGIGDEGRGGNIGGMKIKARRLGVVLDVSGSMDSQIRAVRQEIRKSFSNASIVAVEGCSLDWLEDDPRFDLQQAKGKRLVKNADSVVEAVEVLIVAGKVDAIFWFSDLMDSQSPSGLQRLSHLLGTQFASERRPVKFYVQSVGKKPSTALAGIAKRSGGAVKVESFE